MLTLKPNPQLTVFQYCRIVGTANQCYYAGGPAVLTARMLRFMVDRTHHFYPDDCLNPDSPFGAKNESPAKELSDKENNISFRFYPNPAREQVSIDALLPEGESARLDVSDVKGSHIASYEIENGSRTLDVRNWAPGIYHCRILAQNGKQFATKIVVLK